MITSKQLLGIVTPYCIFMDLAYLYCLRWLYVLLHAHLIWLYMSNLLISCSCRTFMISYSLLKTLSVTKFRCPRTLYRERRFHDQYIYCLFRNGAERLVAQISPIGWLLSYWPLVYYLSSNAPLILFHYCLNPWLYWFVYAIEYSLSLTSLACKGPNA